MIVRALAGDSTMINDFCLGMEYPFSTAYGVMWAAECIGIQVFVGPTPSILGIGGYRLLRQDTTGFA
ncbi:MAG: hypothetical protein GKS05_12975 [Nitrospirales bacterium]|nr:hypothetical protein [Nitrospirales bacterium]NKB82768.1 hypothetical protein [Nitrospirales bacterium]